MRYLSLQRASINRKSRQAGVTLVEGVLALVIAVIVLLGVFALFSSAFSSSKVQNELGYLNTLVGDVETLYATNHNYGTGDITASLVSTKNAPPPMIVGSALDNSWGGAVTVTGATANFTISEAGIPQVACIQMAQASVNPSAISINGTAQTLPLTTAAATTACNSVTSNTIVWTLS